MDQVAQPVAQNLHLDVARAGDVALRKDRAVAKGGQRLGARLGVARRQFFARSDDAHAPPSAAERRFQNQRKSDPGRGLLGLLQRSHGVVCTGKDRHAGLLRQAPRGGLVAEHFENPGRRSDEGDAGLLAGARQSRVFGQKPVARMDQVHALLGRQRDDPLDIEIGLHRPQPGAHQIRLVSLEPVQTEPVLLAVDGDGLESQLVGRAENPDSDLAPVQSKQLLHRFH